MEKRSPELINSKIKQRSVKKKLRGPVKTKLKSERSGEEFTKVEVETKNTEPWRRNGWKRRSPEAPKLKSKCGRRRVQKRES